MNSVDFPGANATFPAKDINQKNMRAHLTGWIRVTAWELTDEDIKKIIETRKVFLLEVIPSPDMYSSIKVLSDNPVPTISRINIPMIKNEKKTKKDA